MAEKKINGSTYLVDRILARDSLVLKARIMQILGGGIGRLPEIMQGAGKNKTPESEAKSNAAAIAAFTDVFVNGDPEKMASLVQDLAERAKIQTTTGSWEPVDMDRDFTGDDKGLFELVVFVLKEVFGDFLADALASGVQKIQAAQTSQSENESE